MRKKKTTTNTKLTSKQLGQEILRLFRQDPKQRLNPRQIAKRLQIDNNKDSIQYALQKLAEENHLEALEDFKYKLKRAIGKAGAAGRGDALEGKVDMTRTGAAYVVIQGREEDVYVAAKNLNSALHGDRVRLRVWTLPGRRRSEGEVVEVVERAREQFIGTFWSYPHYAIVAPDSNLPMDIIVDSKATLDAKDGDKVVVRIDRWSGGQYQNPMGSIVFVLGPAGSHEIEMKSILINNGFNLLFPEEVSKEAESLETTVSEEEIARRRDIRDVLTFTIDPEHAKDFDDALSFRYLENGHLEVGVHIADVSHYVKEGTALDKEAYLRSTSVYLVDRVLPMLPEKLSNELCSLRPLEDKLTFSAIFEFDENDKVCSRWFGKTIIHSNRRFTYEEAQEILESGESEYAASLRKLNSLAKKMRTSRFRKGAIAFETEEVRFRLDDEGTPVEVYVKERKDAHLLIEEFMLLANREVATYITNKGKAEGQEIPFVYRIHDEPNMDKVEDLARFALEMGVQMDITTPMNIARSFNRLAKLAEKDPALRILEPIAIRTMAKAAYSTDNIGHYGLAFEFYSHFTSPIRRYSDVWAHRILHRNLDGATSRMDKGRLEEQCKHISKQERNAMDAERESVKYKQVEFMEKHVGEIFTGYISGFSERGAFIELKDSHCEGMASYETFREPFELDGSRLRIRGVSTGRIYRIGDPIEVRIVRTDLERRQIDMAWAPSSADEEDGMGGNH
ncbi:MAG: ribonuclease R [Haliscomenobacter sp.]|nr:ribonuclease R [Haliscomenobacter sp.]